MNVVYALVAVSVVAVLGALGGSVEALRPVFAIGLPYFACLLFLGGVVYKIVDWARSPVPFRIPTTCGQQKTLDWIKPNNLETPHNLFGVIGRMALEVLVFRSLFRNTKVELHAEGPKVAYGPTKWLWLGALVFHWTMLAIVMRHLRFFTEPVPFWVRWLQELDGFFQIGVPIVYLTTLGFVAGVTYLFIRRVVIPQVRYISLLNDYFPLFLLAGIGATGIILRHFVKTDIVGVKSLTIGLISLTPSVPDTVHWWFYVHFFFVTVLFAYFPFSKLMHMPGIFMSPTRNLANNNRAVRHVNPWNPKVKVHTYEEYEDEFRERMVECGLPVDKPLEKEEPPPAEEAKAEPAAGGDDGDKAE